MGDSFVEAVMELFAFLLKIEYDYFIYIYCCNMKKNRMSLKSLP